MKIRKSSILLMVLTFTILFLPLPALAVVDWTKDDVNNPVLSPDGPATWEQNWLNLPRVIKDGSNYKMWYMGGGPEAGTAAQIGYATSPDGTTWSKHGSNPIFQPGVSGKFDDENIFGSSVLKEASNDYKMWYAGNNIYNDYNGMQIGYATSSDGIAWARQNSGDPVLQKGGANDWDGDGVGGAVINDGGIYKMWYVGWNNSQGTSGIGYATSADGISWTKYNDPSTTTDPYANSDPVITPGQEGAWDHSWPCPPSVIKEDSIFRMWYASYPGGADEHDKIGYAYSYDGINWRKYDGNPVIMEGDTATDDFDENGAMDPVVYKDGNTYKMWYAGVSWSGATEYAKFGYATSQAYQGDPPAINYAGVASLNFLSGLRITLYVKPEGPGPLDINELKVDGPSGFTYIFSDWDVMNVMGNQLPIVVFPDPVNTGVYTFTVKTNNGQTASNTVTLGGSTLSAPEDGEAYLNRSVNDGIVPWNTSTQVYVGNATPHFRWEPYLGDSYYYKILIMDWRNRAVWYSPDPKLGSTKSGDGFMYSQVPSGILKPDTPYQWRVEVLDTNNLWSGHNRSRSTQRYIYTGTKDDSGDFLNDAMGSNKAGMRSTRSFRAGEYAFLWAFVYNIAPWDITTFRADDPSDTPYHYFDVVNEAFTVELGLLPFLYSANETGLPTSGDYDFYIGDGTLTDTHTYTITRNDTLPQVTKKDISHESGIGRTDNAYLPDNEPTFTWKSKGDSYKYRVSIFDWNFRRFVLQSAPMDGLTAGSDMSFKVPAGTLKGYSPYRFWIEVYDSSQQNRTRSQFLSFMTGRDLSAGSNSLPAMYLLLLGD